jgi:hypothetical protein
MVVAVGMVNGTVFRWNLTAPVGPMQPNKLDDVEYVRFAYFCLGQNPKSTSRLDLKAQIDQLALAGPFDQDLADLIRAHQSLRGGTQDGIVSVERISATSTNRELYDSAHAWMLSSLSNNIIDITIDIFPRIDLHSRSGPEVSRVVKAIFLGST